MNEQTNRKTLISIRVSTLLLIVIAIIVLIVVGVSIANKVKQREELEVNATATASNVQNSEYTSEANSEVYSETAIRDVVISSRYSSGREQIKSEEEFIELEEAVEEIPETADINNEEIAISEPALETNEIIENVTEEIVQEEPIATTPIDAVTISKDMDLTARTGLSRDDFILLISGVEQDTSNFFEENAGLIYDLCEKYQLNEIFFCGLISAESGWTIAQNHRNTHNYISLMSSRGLIRYSSVEEGLEKAAQVLHDNYLTQGGKFYYGTTLSAVKTKFCPASSNWVNLVYQRMSQILN